MAHLHQEWPPRVRRSMRVSILTSPRTESPWPLAKHFDEVILVISVHQRPWIQNLEYIWIVHRCILYNIPDELAHQACHARQLQRQQISSATKIHAPERINLSNFCRDMCSNSRTESPCQRQGHSILIAWNSAIIENTQDNISKSSVFIDADVLGCINMRHQTTFNALYSAPDEPCGCRNSHMHINEIFVSNDPAACLF